ncbi:outer surface protein [Aureimonas sp. SA4125]|uniref:outer membrane protein n=1 Tax=Aureimonas sp. SA4125 TaxID=2826993 RepID=UPI001CC77F8D|nr:outer membrane beta-barrel protein [Aureimonas sp. SA4125]BDA83238.1 outer surface protein [Aureimonas sp. SA4125]
MKTVVKSLLLSVAALVAVSHASLAADIIEPIYEEVPEIVPVEVGSGWYLRGDVSYDFKSDLDAGYRTFGPVGCPGGCGIDPIYDDQDYDGFEIEAGANVGVGFGYQFTDYFRGDLTAHYWKADVSGTDEGGFGIDCYGNAITDATCRSKDTSKVSAWELMANAYVDLGTFAGFTPYVGAGVGAVHVKYDDFTNSSYSVVDGAEGALAYSATHAGASDWRFAYALMAGASYDLTRSLKVDVGYRYVNVDEGDMFAFDSYTAGFGASGAQGKDEGFDRHTIQAGLRYSLF